MREVSFSEAKARLSSVVDAAKEGEATVITRHGRKEAVVLSYEEWAQASGPRSLWEMLLNAPIDGRELETSRSKMRDVDL
ncbi:type II toxin-antitoxin system Phd/YefM family antitoxin [Chelatococcus sambhunathii]|uniref:Antitoxin n=1 Tax=Chelatococcus sambhunathii TaxID=363953 RepID=A0ABU1DJB2_9HYPH|nr:type II toxin-antitoxin system Phd/YefM family antitoxin [Chelatococcus sambhunathii]MDR4308219.1 type II toxin-antitoxin system Phd/YefM family antitoxin [Chelatococcus sambhunathii]